MPETGGRSRAAQISDGSDAKRGAVMAGALHAAISGVREVLDPPVLTPQIVEVSPDPAPAPDARVRLLFVPHAPRATRAYVRW